MSQEMRKLINQVKNIGKRQINESSYMSNPKEKAHNMGGMFSGFIIPNSPKYTYGPDEDGTYHFEFLLGFDKSHKIEAEEVKDHIGGGSYGGAGQEFSSINVSFEGQKNGKYIFRVYERGGYDI